MPKLRVRRERAALYRNLHAAIDPALRQLQFRFADLPERRHLGPVYGRRRVQPWHRGLLLDLQQPWPAKKRVGDVHIIVRRGHVLSRVQRSMDRNPK